MKLIAAISTNGIIGAKENGKDIIPWHYPEDFAHFKKLTLNSTVIMGDITYFSIIGISGKPLPKRRNVVLTKNKLDDSIEQYNSIYSLLKNVDREDSWIIGGRSIYEQMIPYCNELHLTIVPSVDPSKFDDVVRFPFINPSRFKPIQKTNLTNSLEYVILERYE
jgi:dihydrofolate reductase